MTHTETFAKENKLILKMVTEDEFCGLARAPAFPFDNPNHRILRQPFIYCEQDGVVSAIDVTHTDLYCYVGRPK